MKSWHENLDAVRRALAQQDAALRTAYEAMDRRQTIYAPTQALRRLAEQCGPPRMPPEAAGRSLPSGVGTLRC